MTQDQMTPIAATIVDAYLRHQYPRPSDSDNYSIYPSNFAHEYAILLSQVKGDHQHMLNDPRLQSIWDGYSIFHPINSNKSLIIPYCDDIGWDTGHWFAIIIERNPTASKASIAAYDSLGWSVKKRIKKRGVHYFLNDMMLLLKHIIGTNLFESPPQWTTVEDLVRITHHLYHSD